MPSLTAVIHLTFSFSIIDNYLFIAGIVNMYWNKVLLQPSKIVILDLLPFKSIEMQH